MGRYRIEPVDKLTPERVFERHWAVTLLELAVSKLEDEFSRAGKGHVFRVLRQFLGGATGKPAYSQVATDLGMTEAAVKMAVHRLRCRYRELLREAVDGSSLSRRLRCRKIGAGAERLPRRGGRYAEMVEKWRNARTIVGSARLCERALMVALDNEAKCLMDH